MHQEGLIVSDRPHIVLTCNWYGKGGRPLLLHEAKMVTNSNRWSRHWMWPFVYLDFHFFPPHMMGNCSASHSLILLVAYSTPRRPSLRSKRGEFLSSLEVLCVQSVAWNPVKENHLQFPAKVLRVYSIFILMHKRVFQWIMNGCLRDSKGGKKRHCNYISLFFSPNGTQDHSDLTCPMHPTAC